MRIYGGEYTNSGRCVTTLGPGCSAAESHEPVVKNIRSSLCGLCEIFRFDDPWGSPNAPPRLYAVGRYQGLGELVTDDSIPIEDRLFEFVVLSPGLS